MQPPAEMHVHERLTLVSGPGRPASPEAFLEAFDTAQVPTSPGCYIMRDMDDRVIYVGKAKNLRSRVRQYINDQDSRYSVKFLMQRVAHIDFLLTTNEKEAVLLENSLIKQFKPRYNVHWKDDKSYVNLRVNTKEDFPRITVMRKHRNDGATYFGPYSSAQATRDTLKQIHRVFPLRTCTDNVMKNRTRPCIYYQMKRCVAPCVDYVTPEAYGEIVRQAVLVIAGRSGEVEKQLREQIQRHADALEFEQAAELRDRLHALQRTLEKQRTVDVAGVPDRDVFGLHTHGRFAEIQVLFFRAGKMVGGRSFSFKRLEMPLEEVLSSFLLQYYSQAPVIPQEVVIPYPLEEAESIEQILSEQRGSRVRVVNPKRGERSALIRIAERNARKSFEEKQLTEKAQSDLLEAVKQILHLRRVPDRIECFDISTYQGDRTVASMVVFEGGHPNKDRYRRYSMKQTEGQDDFASMREVLMRRYTRAIEEDDLPDLVLIDGGKGQLNVARTVLQDLGIEDLDLASIAKSRALESGGHSPERFFIPGRSNPIVPDQQSPVVHLLARVRDEAHRFAITYQRQKRSKGTLRTSLTRIEGVGPERSKRLLRAFGSVAKIREATIDELTRVPGISESLAGVIRGELRGDTSASERND